jgi:hypothetical protein
VKVVAAAEQLKNKFSYCTYNVFHHIRLRPFLLKLKQARRKILNPIELPPLILAETESLTHFFADAANFGGEGGVTSAV